MTKITTTDVQDMASHWLETPLNGYLGSSYGSNIPDFLQRPLATGQADGVITKLRADVPLIGALPAGSVNLYAQDVPPDQRNYFLDIAGQAVEIGDR
ncbi:hypothetical protein [Burkholderia gladioli]|uniref:hypothetical protein n=1 Tax=Burkholderia gladioli TaxID=28095 RepID=UPI001641BBEE|nr:hypothetical protein [Burkholderia gladioli]